MPDEMNPNDPRNLWQGQEVEKVILTVDEVRRRSARFERRVHWRNVREYIAGVFVIAFGTRAGLAHPRVARDAAGAGDPRHNACDVSAPSARQRPLASKRCGHPRIYRVSPGGAGAPARRPAWRVALVLASVRACACGRPGGNGNRSWNQCTVDRNGSFLRSDLRGHFGSQQKGRAKTRS